MKCVEVRIVGIIDTVGAGMVLIDVELRGNSHKKIPKTNFFYMSK
jgi:hypothetical protein